MFRAFTALRWLVVVLAVTALPSLFSACASESQQPETRRLELTIETPYEGPRSVAEGTAAHEKVTAALRRDTERDEWVPVDLRGILVDDDPIAYKCGQLTCTCDTEQFGDCFFMWFKTDGDCTENEQEHSKTCCIEDDCEQE
jgi:hypothetical protein